MKIENYAKDIQLYKKFLENSENVDNFIESDAIIWIDWRGNDEDIILYEEKMDRDNTINYLNEYIKPIYEIRFCMESLGNDTLAFCLLEENLWNELEKEFGLEKIRLKM